jgi:tRNA-(ms[2]io[6]A)-hydroxylase
MSFFRLQMRTDPLWVQNVVQSNISEILTDHAFCEQKAASSAISLIILYPEHTELVTKMAALVREEMGHFQMVHELIKRRGYTLGRERKDSYVNELGKFLKSAGRSRSEVLADRLLFAAMIEARSCERFKVLSEKIEDEELAKFYFSLMKSEARHYTMFIKLARKLVPDVDVDARWRELLEFEGEVIERYGRAEGIHG